MPQRSGSCGAALCGAIALLLCAMPAWAQLMPPSSVATDNATVQPAGPRTGGNGKRFFNIEGDSFGNFSSFGVADFATSAFSVPTPVSAMDVPATMTVRLADAPAAFSAAGLLNFYFVEDTAADIEPGTSLLTYMTGASPPGVGTQLGAKHFLGTGEYAPTTAGNLFYYPLSLDSSARAYVAGRINAGGTLRLVITPANNANPGGATTAGTYAGFTSDGTTQRTDGLAPTLFYGLIPEPASAGLLMTGAAGLLLRRRAGQW